MFSDNYITVDSNTQNSSYVLFKNGEVLAMISTIDVKMTR